MFWVDKIADKVVREKESRISKGETLIVRDEKTASGHPHVGSLLGVAVHDVVARVLNERGVPATFQYEINDMDPMDGLPIYLDEAVYREHMGKPLCFVPAPDDSAKNLAEYFANDFKDAILEAGFTPEFYKLSEVYRSGKMNDVIRTALEHADDIRAIYKKVSGSTKPDDWLPLNVICEQCGKVGTTKVTSFDGEQVAYTCQERGVEWATGCGHEGRVSPFDGNATLPWKVEWAAKFKVLNVSVEGAGKDHSTKGGSRDVANHIAESVFGSELPVNIPYEFFLVGGKKMSSSKGNASTAREIVDLLPPHLLSLALIGRDIVRQVNFDPAGDSVPVLFDQYDRLAEKYWSESEDDGARVFSLIHTSAQKQYLEQRFLPRFSQIAFLIQMPHMDVFEEVGIMKGETLTDADRMEIELRVTYARRWLDTYADEAFIYTLQSELPPHAKNLTDEQRSALTLLGTRIQERETYDGQSLHEMIHAVREESGLPPKAFFSAIYVVFLGKESGPKAGWFLSTLEKDFLVNRLLLKK